MAGIGGVLISLWLPAFSGGVTFRGIDMMTAVLPMAARRLLEFSDVEQFLVSLGAVVAVSGNVVLPLIAIYQWRPANVGAGQRRVAVVIVVTALVLTVYLALASPLQPQTGALIWLGGMVVLLVCIMTRARA